MAASPETSPATANMQNDASKSLQLPKDYKRKLSKKGKDERPNGAHRDDKSTAGGSSKSSLALGDAGPSSQSQTLNVRTTSANGAADESRSGAGDWQDPSQAASSAGAAHLDTPTSTADASYSNEKTSLSTTVTGTATSSSKHRKDKTASETIHSEKTGSRSTNRKAMSPRKRKVSFWQKIASVFTCTWPPDRAHRVDVDDGELGLSDPSSSAIGLRVVLPSEKEKEASQKRDDLPSVPETSASGAKPDISFSSKDEPPISVAPDLVLPDTSEPSVVVPPSPTTHVLSPDITGGLTSGAVQPPGSTGREAGDESEGTSFTEEDEEKELQEIEDEEERLIMNGGAGIPIGPDGVPRPLLPPIAPQHAGRKCLVLDLDETLVHSSFKSIQHADYVVPVEIEYHWHNVYVIKRPGVDNFLKKMGEIYEIVVFTASLSKYADPVLDKLDIHQVVSHRLFRESCYNHKGNYVKDLSQLGRPIGDTIILDNSPASYIFHPNNAVPVSSWFNDPHDTELTDLVPFLADLGTVDDVRGVLDGGL